MRNSLLFVVIAIIFMSATSNNSKSEIIAIYNLDSVKQSNERCAREDMQAKKNFENQKRYEQQQSPTISPDQLNKKQKHELDKVKDKVENSPADKRKNVIRDSLYWKDSVPARCERRMERISGDFRKALGYKQIMSTDEYRTFKLTSEGSTAKFENVTLNLAQYANQDTVAAKYMQYQY